MCLPRWNETHYFIRAVCASPIGNHMSNDSCVIKFSIDVAKAVMAGWATRSTYLLAPTTLRATILVAIVFITSLFMVTHVFPNAYRLDEVKDRSCSACGIDHVLLGGGPKSHIPFNKVCSYVVGGKDNISGGADTLKFVDHVDDVALGKYPSSLGFVHMKMPITELVLRLSIPSVRKVAATHGVPTKARLHQSDILTLFSGHRCQSCKASTSVFTVNRKAERERMRKQIKRSSKVDDKYQSVRHSDRNGVSKKQSSNADKEPQSVTDTSVSLGSSFPPDPPDRKLVEAVVRNFCAATSPSELEEGGCAVCGMLIPVKNLTRLKALKNMLHILEVRGVTRSERYRDDDPIKEQTGPVIDRTCSYICNPCRGHIRKGSVPPNALAKGYWIGQVPEELKGLNFIEKLLVSRVRHSNFVVKVSSGFRKMKCNAVCFESPTPKIYDILPPPVEDLDEVLAILFSGPAKPSEADLARTPFLVRRNAVAKALDWLKLNHPDYADIDISHDNLSRYPTDRPPVQVSYKHSTSNKTPESTSLFDRDDEDGVEEGDCPFVVNGLTGEWVQRSTFQQMKGKAVQHWLSGGAALEVNHARHPESIFKNPTLYSQLFPWLFPYGLGSPGEPNHEGISTASRKKALMMYHDKRFQKDELFALLSFNHEQMKAASTGGFLLAEKEKFEEISDRILSINLEVMGDLANRMAKGESVLPESEEEHKCFQVLNDLDHVNGRVPGSITSKKWMRNKIWSLIAYRGAPQWYITLNPSDTNHPISLYYAGSDKAFSPQISIDLSETQRRQLSGSNPAASARFFNLIVNNFVDHVLGKSGKHPGLYGKTSAYYGTVEQQGRLSLHLHALVWIENSPTPEEIRLRLLDFESDFGSKLTTYLESAHQGELMSGPSEEVTPVICSVREQPSYEEPTKTLPEAPPVACENKDRCSCNTCTANATWWQKFRTTVDDLLLRLNLHVCREAPSPNTPKSRLYCVDAVLKKCTFRFPRPKVLQSFIDPETGSFTLKHIETRLNTITPVLTYLLRCNIDVTSLRSGTSIKAVLLYISNYITKPSLKTYAVFDCIKSVFQRNADLIVGSDAKQQKARGLITRMVNSMNAKMEIGSPMACMYLLQHPDHYTDHLFTPFYWRSYVRETGKPWERSNDTDKYAKESFPEKLALLKKNGRVIGLSPVHDYVHRCSSLSHMTLYEWISLTKRVKISNKQSGGKSLKRKRTSEESEYEEEHADELPDEIVPEELLEETDADAESPEIVDRGSSTLYPFRDAHPLAESHATAVVKEGSARVPNMIGGTLPQRDHGDREFYCQTMLTLFRPWRSGHDLRGDNESWDESFANYAFPERYVDVMKNLNIRYECLDAKDDFFSQLKKGTTAVPSWMTDASVMDADQYDDAGHVEEASALVDLHESIEDSLMEVVGPKSAGRAKAIQTMRTICNRLGLAEVGQPIATGLNEQDMLSSELPGVSDCISLVARKRDEVLEERKKNAPDDHNNWHRSQGTNQVRVVTYDHLRKLYSPPKWSNNIDDIIHTRTLNEEQERAFRIVANHASTPGSSQLKMYIGGMGGTGKSQVLHAIKDYFSQTNQSHRFVVVAPTGTASAMLQGSTYHYMFGINDRSTSAKSKAKACERLKGVEYIFIDEVSMVSCMDLYKIGHRLAEIMGDYQSPFGGLNLIFAGDFAQLAPVPGGEDSALYSWSVGNSKRIKENGNTEKAALGKALWHQVTTVVILRKNMRQKKQNPRDDKLRTALENLRYKSCTTKDIAFFRSLISSNAPGRQSITDPRFRSAPIITGLNAHKDAINELVAERWAVETGQELVYFVSNDNYSSPNSKEPDDEEGVAKWRKETHRKPGRGVMSERVQRMLWDQLPSANDKHVAARLPLCPGMPVMIRCNLATELCITKGQDAIVVGWREAPEQKYGERLLDVLFVKLVNPPESVHLEGLPKNVVPLPRSTTSCKVNLPDDTVVSIAHSQVEVQLNFALTDYASQGKTRPDNPVDLNNIRSHQGYYTALSRSASEDGTLILQGFDPRKMTGGVSGALRQEFRELELLDEITRMTYENTLPAKARVVDETRNAVIDAYRRWRGEQYVPRSVHKALRWSKRDPLVAPSHNGLSWRGFNDQSDAQGKDKASRNKSKSMNYTQSVGEADEDKELRPHKRLKSSIQSAKPPDGLIHLDKEAPVGTRICKRARATSQCEGDDHDQDARVSSIKRVKVYHETGDKAGSVSTSAITNTAIPVGTRWHNNSCAYDAIITILRNIWVEDPNRWKTVFSQANMYLQGISDGLSECQLSGDPSYDGVRDTLQRSLTRDYPRDFVEGDLTSVHELLHRIMTCEFPVISSTVACPQFDHRPRNLDYVHVYGWMVSVPREYIGLHLRDFVRSWTTVSQRRCTYCSSNLVRSYAFIEAPPIVCFDISANIITPNKTVRIPVYRAGQLYQVSYCLKGIIYYANEHFVSRIMAAADDIWFHDGMITGISLVREGNISDDGLRVCGQALASAAIYVANPR